ncbi:peroxidase domain-containing protein, partial [Cephalotus follicularis]
MASISYFFATISIFITLLVSATNAQLSADFYARTCPDLHRIVRNTMTQAVNGEPRDGASMLRLSFHDCFVNGCDGSILLDDTSTFTGEKNAAPNANSARGFEVIDTIKTRVEASCSATVSCADILQLAARDGVVLLGGPSWTVPLGRRDARTASQSAANSQIPSPFSNLTTLISMFSAKGLSARDMTTLSGAHTIGLAQCRVFRSRIYNETNINPSYANARRTDCPVSGGDSNLASLDIQTPNRFDNGYYQNLLGQRGLLHSDQELFINEGSQNGLVRTYSNDVNLFNSDFAAAMVRLSSISPLTGNHGEIRRNCARDMTALSGGHTIGLAQCRTFRPRIYNDTNIDPTFASARRANCPVSGGDSNLANLDRTPTRFDNTYFVDLVNRRGLLHSDQELFNGGSQDALVRSYRTINALFSTDFAAAMVRMGNISPLTGSSGEIRRNC